MIAFTLSLLLKFPFGSTRF